jgi:hypothetical protein
LLLAPTDQEVSPNIATTQIIAYYNAAVEFEHLTMFAEAVENYRKGLGIAEAHLPASHPLTENVGRSLKSCELRMSSVKQFTLNRRGLRENARVTPHLIKKSEIEVIRKSRSTHPRMRLQLPPISEKKQKSVNRTTLSERRVPKSSRQVPENLRRQYKTYDV